MNIELIISVLAIVIAVLSASLSREHNKLSVRPLLFISRFNFPDERVSLVIENGGTGPAIIESISIKIGNNTYNANSFTWTIEVMPLLKSLKIIPEELDSIPLDVLSVNEMFVLGTNNKMFMLKAQPNSKTDYLYAVKVINAIHVNVKYRSIYKEHFSLTS